MLTANLDSCFLRVESAFLLPHQYFIYPQAISGTTHQEAHIPSQKFTRGRNASHTAAEGEKQLFVINTLRPLCRNLSAYSHDPKFRELITYQEVYVTRPECTQGVFCARLPAQSSLVCLGDGAFVERLHQEYVRCFPPSFYA